MKCQSVQMAVIGQEKSLRYDVDYHLYYQKAERDFYRFEDLFEIIVDDGVPVDDLYCPFLYCEIGNVDKNGQVSPVLLDFSERSLEDESYYKKIEKGDIIAVRTGDILIAKVRPNLKKYVRVTEETSCIYVTSAFIHIRAKRIPEILYYCFRSAFHTDLMAISRQGKGYPTISESDLRELRFSRKAIDALEQNSDKLTRVVHDLESRIKTINRNILPPQRIIDNILSDCLGVDVDGLRATDKTHDLSMLFNTISANNESLRSSYRWEKAIKIQNALVSMADNCVPLGTHILSTKNGWSPECDENASSYKVLSLDALSWDTELKMECVKKSDLERNNLDQFILRDGDFLVSRGNGSDELVGLASIVHIVEDDDPIIYPDIMIRVCFDDAVEKQYIAYIFNSSIGRLFFKYASKGSNKKKITPLELGQFRTPLPDHQMQTSIVEKIQAAFSSQKKLESEIERLRLEIEKTIVDVIVGDSLYHE